MADDAWSEARSQLKAALEKAREAGMTYIEVSGCVDDTWDDYDVAEADADDLESKKKTTE